MNLNVFQYVLCTCSPVFYWLAWYTMSMLFIVIGCYTLERSLTTVLLMSVNKIHRKSGPSMHVFRI